MTLFLKALVPVTNRAKLTFDSGAKLQFTKKQVALLVALVLVGAVSATGWLTYRYNGTSRSADFSDKERVAANKAATELVLDKAEDLEEDATIVCIVDKAMRPMFTQKTDYTVAVYRLEEENFNAGVAADKDYSMDTLWNYSKSGPKKDPYQSLTKIAEATYVMNEKTQEITGFQFAPAE